MAHWQDQEEVSESTTLCHMNIGNGLGAEIEKITNKSDESEYRLTLGTLFASESVRFPYTQMGLENLLKTLVKAKNEDGPTKPIGGKMETRDHIND